MTDQVLDILKLVLLALLYLFFARVLWAVWSEVRTPGMTRSGGGPARMAPGEAPTVSADRPVVAPGPKPKKGQHGRAARLVVIEPKSRRGAAWALTGELTIGRDPACTITIDDDTFVSGLHARIFDHDGQPMVEDLNSTNGSFHNGNPLSGIKLLHPGDRIQIGYTVLEAQ